MQNRMMIPRDAFLILCKPVTLVKHETRKEFIQFYINLLIEQEILGYSTTLPERIFL